MVPSVICGPWQNLEKIEFKVVLFLHHFIHSLMAADKKTVQFTHLQTKSEDCHTKKLMTYRKNLPLSDGMLHDIETQAKN